MADRFAVERRVGGFFGVVNVPAFTCRSELAREPARQVARLFASKLAPTKSRAGRLVGQNE